MSDDMEGWPLLVSESVKTELLEMLAEMVHEENKSDFARGYENGMAMVMVFLGISEAGSPERKSL